ncbi:hypothetical protein H6P81_019329 [Aristolochia fimbriata]|uniref:FYR C-terminal domain-containing protein n=1 Tax=Aristolochia fimbriata TaxID=158543 RepID=A0AAV7DT51_ARIFI|nr:hypothetical protein H6P81_019329 [Aristolochia fimbriata]
MATPDRDNTDGLEIISVGTLYRGPFDRKYWSSSRGKDRHPYPIGYHAVRTHAGSKYKMNIHEGLKGPLFLISCLDEESSSGQTPDMAWENFQRKSGPRVKTLHGKRLSCKIDGVELFGFRNPLVQRLLRELVASLNGTAERSLFSPHSCDENSREKHVTQIPDFCKFPGLVPYLEEQQSTGGSGKLTNKSRKSSRENLHERSHSCVAAQDAKIDSVMKETQFNPYGEHSICSMSFEQPLGCNTGMFPIETKKDCALSDRSNSVSKFPTSKLCMIAYNTDENQEWENLETKQVPVDIKVTACCPSSVKEYLHLASPRAVSCFLEKASTLPQQQKIDRSSDVDSHNDDSLTATKDGGEVSKSQELKHENNVEDCVADTLDYAQSKIVDDSEEPISGLNLGEDIGWFGSSNESSEKSDCNSFGQDLPMSMLKVLLPSAIPLIKHTYKRKTPRGHIAETSKHDSLYLVQTEAYKKSKSSHNRTCNKSRGGPEANEPDDLVNESTSKALLAESKHHGDTNLVIPDSFDIAAHDFTPDVPLPSDFHKTTHSLPEKMLSSPNILCLPIRLDQTREPSKTQHVNEENVEGYHDKAVISGKGQFEQDPVPPESVKIDILQPSFGCFEQLPTFPDLEVQDSNIQKKHTKSSHREPCPTAKGAADDKTEDYIDCQQEVPHSYSPAEKDCDRHSKSSHADADSLMRTIHSTKIECVNSSCNDIDGQIMQAGGTEICVQHQCLDTLRRSPDSKGLMSKIDQSTLSCPAIKGCADDHDCSMSSMREKTEVVDPKKELECLVEPVGCYTHPAPILSLLLSKEGNDICICVICGDPTESEQMLFIYKTSIWGKAPDFLGYTSIILPTIGGIMDKTVSVESSILQFSSDAQQLILLDSVKAPLCREQNIHCLCSTCTSDSCEENALKVVHVKFGYISLVNKFRTLNCICCLLVCEPNYLLVAEEDGRLHVWVMNLTWSASEEEFDLPTLDCAHSMWDLKRLPRCSSLIIGHNGTGIFGLWDISKRVLLTSFSSPGNSISQVIPIGIFCCQKVQSLADLKEEQIKEIMAETKMSFLRADKDHSVFPSFGENVIIWLLMSTASAEDPNTLPMWSWRLGLLVKNVVLTGDVLDSRASAANALGGQGIIGTFDGLVYMWDLSTGAKFANLHFDKGDKDNNKVPGGSISRIVTDGKSGAFAVAEGCNLRIFVKSSIDAAEH